MAKRRVVVTGIGMVTPIGNDAPTTWRALVEGRSGIGRITRFDPSDQKAQIAGEVKDFDPLRYMDAREARHMERSVQFAVVASGEAIQDAGLEITPANADRIGVIVGTSVGGIALLMEQYKVMEERGPGRVSPFLSNGLPDSAASQIAISFGARGPNMAVVSACASGGHATGEAVETIRRGAAEVMLACGADSLIIPVMVASFNSMRALATGNAHPQEACKPFDLRRDGFVVGEGAATLLLEELDHARARGAHIYAEVVGYGSSNDAFHMSIPSEGGEGVVRAMKMALADAGMPPDAVNYVNAHGTGTLLNDKYETAAIKTVFGKHAYNLAVSSTKSMIGHCMGAAGAIEGVITVLSLCKSVIPPTINLRVPDPECDLDYVPLEARHADMETAMSNSIGLGGHNSVLLFSRAGV
jgi:beta-ketoacyl-acyl-carrier-protein synthase II